MASSPYAMKNIYQLHELYGKHVNKFVANIEWLDEERNIFSCDCGAFIDVVARTGLGKRLCAVTDFGR